MIFALQNNLGFNKIYLYSILVFAFTLPLSKAAISFFIILIPLIWIFEGSYKSKLQKLKSSMPILILLSYMILATLSLLWTDDIERGFSSLKKLTYFFTAFVIFTSLKKEDIKKVISAFLLGVFVSEIISYSIFFKLLEFSSRSTLNPSPFMHHMYYSVFLVLASMILLNRIFSQNYTNIQKILFILFFMSITGNLFIGIGRTGQLIFIITVLLTIFLNLKISIKSILISLSILSIIFFSAYNLSSNFEKRANKSVQEVNKILNLNLNTSWGIRIAYWITTYNIILENPFGVGYGDYINATKEELCKEGKYDYLSNKTKKFMSDIHPHNQYLLILLQTGIIGLLLFLIFLYQLFKLDIKDNELKNLKFIFLIIFLISCFAGPQLYRHFPLALNVLFIGIFLQASDNKICKKN